MTAVIWWKLTWPEPQAIRISIFPSILSFRGRLQHTSQLQHLAASSPYQVVGTFLEKQVTLIVVTA
ncbi:uncharacterized protein N7487_008811 [Penicillium crustosum]|uniref:uncharacterized protein n=1 Tax=Penicillium crustosum TaxID=36656 RepID=UPI0023867D1E|nr:uncharacterized protein N7487_008811 [Penicillium crustosum]KAJ5402915.1 hypothetical protein N7487_008811 [Penicillium crustosum]